jgi:hypothetical protein
MAGTSKAADEPDAASYPTRAAYEPEPDALGGKRFHLGRPLNLNEGVERWRDGIVELVPGGVMVAWRSLLVA